LSVIHQYHLAALRRRVGVRMRSRVLMIPERGRDAVEVRVA
jgi:hypothetical protein